MGSSEIRNDQDKSKRELIATPKSFGEVSLTIKTKNFPGRVSAKLGVGTEVTFTLRHSQAIG
ncbi:MAG: hypothetical protein CMM16_04790 [Rhodospirillaceae bacterium]|nr:hypothetical protein [Rhodospirillaceae bacterium]